MCKLLCYDEAISGAIVEYACLHGNGTVKTDSFAALKKQVCKIMCLQLFRIKYQTG